MHPRDTPNYDVLKARENLGGKFLSYEEQQACKTRFVQTEKCSML